MKWIVKRNFNRSKQGFQLKNKFSWRWKSVLLNKRLCLKSKNKMQKPWKSAWSKKENLMNKKLQRKQERKLKKRERHNKLLLLKPKKLKKKQLKKLKSLEFNKSREPSYSKFKLSKNYFLNNKKKNNLNCKLSNLHSKRLYKIRREKRRRL